METPDTAKELPAGHRASARPYRCLALLQIWYRLSGCQGLLVNIVLNWFEELKERVPVP